MTIGCVSLPSGCRLTDWPIIFSSMFDASGPLRFCQTSTASWAGSIAVCWIWWARRPSEKDNCGLWTDCWRTSHFGLSCVGFVRVLKVSCLLNTYSSYQFQCPNFTMCFIIKNCGRCRLQTAFSMYLATSWREQIGHKQSPLWARQIILSSGCFKSPSSILRASRGARLEQWSIRLFCMKHPEPGIGIQKKLWQLWIRRSTNTDH